MTTDTVAEGDYLLSDSTIIWSGRSAASDDLGAAAGADVDFHNDVAVIVRDNAGGLETRIARSVNDDEPDCDTDDTGGD